MERFTPVSASIGGVLIGLSATMLWVVNGWTAGITRHSRRLLDGPDGRCRMEDCVRYRTDHRPVLYGMAGKNCRTSGTGHRLDKAPLFTVRVAARCGSSPRPARLM